MAYRCGFSLRRLREPQKFEVKGECAGKVRPLLHKEDPYEGFNADEWPDDTSGWGSDSPAFVEVIELLKPSRIIEVGTWKGGSALTMAREVERLGFDTEIICVDTWLGALEMWVDPSDPNRHGALSLKNGYPSIYYTFIANVVRANQSDVITPFPVPSITAAQWCALKGVRADMIYLDASHEEEDVYQDLVCWWDLVGPGGVMLGDDWNWDGVRMAVERFAKEQKLQIFQRHDKWELRR